MSRLNFTRLEGQSICTISRARFARVSANALPQLEQGGIQNGLE